MEMILCISATMLIIPEQSAKKKKRCEEDYGFLGEKVKDYCRKTCRVCPGAPDKTDPPTTLPPTDIPSNEPTAFPTYSPTNYPTASPTDSPSYDPSASPSSSPSYEPSSAPSVRKRHF
mmetsp:Transcript_24512/g.56006  ORF Transcript_24512/g.56006 Transcript_24512/m.56006 type:complete len:118 (-) Transcript_24512:600-953(-)